MDDLQFYILFNSISVVPGQWEDDIERIEKIYTSRDWSYMARSYKRVVPIFGIILEEVLHLINK